MPEVPSGPGATRAVARFRVGLDAQEATCMRVAEPGRLGDSLVEAGLPLPSPVVVVVGGAGGVAPDDLERLTPVFVEGLVPAVERAHAAVVDGGTDAGVMRIIGRARSTSAQGFPLVGVVAEGTVRLPGSPNSRNDAAELEPHHTDFVVVPGIDWGDESPWISATASALARDRPSVTVLVNGGEIAYADVSHSLDAGRSVIVVVGSGRTADEIARATCGETSDPRASAFVRSGMVGTVPLGEPARLYDALVSVLG